MANAAGLLKDVPAPLFTVFGSRGEVKVKELQVGDEAVKDLTAIVMDHPTVQAISDAFEKKLGGPIDGIVGFPFFARFKMTLDYQAKTVTLVPNGYNPPNVMEAMMTAIMASSSDEPKVLAPAAQWGVVAEKDAKDAEAGVNVKTVLAGSPAEAAGLKAGDRVLTVDGRWTDTLVDLYTAAGYVKPGATVPGRGPARRQGKDPQGQTGVGVVKIHHKDTKNTKKTKGRVPSGEDLEPCLLSSLLFFFVFFVSLW